jgi:hypothetical protein
MLTTSYVYHQPLCAPSMDTLSRRDALGLIGHQEEGSESPDFEEGTF